MTMKRKYICKYWYSQKLAKPTQNLKCRQNCKFYHPETIKDKYTQEFHRELGKCYCGSELMTLMSTKDDDIVFFRVCSLTRRSILKCRK